MEINIAPEGSGEAIEATDQDFEAKVIHRSQEIPVLVDFWAPWCEPCKTLTPVLEKLAKQYEGRVELVKVNMDESPMLAQVLRIQSIPAVKLFLNGAIQDEFMGAYPEPEVVQFLENNLPSEAVEDAVLGMQMLQQGDSAGAARIFEQVLASDPKNPVALIGSGHLRVDDGDLDGARELVAQINEVDLEKITERQQLERLLGALRARIYLNGHVEPAPEQPTEKAGKFAQACRAALEGNHGPALETFLEFVRTDRKFMDDGGRLAMLAVFDLLPQGHPLVMEYRQKLSSILFS